MNAHPDRLLAAPVAPASTQVPGGADTQDAAAMQWLDELAVLLPAMRRAFVLMEQGGGQLGAAAVRPAGTNPELARPLVTEALMARGPVQRATDAGHEVVLPLLADERICAVVYVELRLAAGRALDDAVATVQWGTGWLRAAWQGGRHAALAQQTARARQAVDLALGALHEPSFKASAMALSNQLCRLLACDAVHLAWVEKGGARIVARSHSAWHDGRTELVRQAEQALDEALDQDLVVALPPLDAATLVAVRAHQAYLQATAGTALLSLPLRCHGGTVGGLLLERREPFTEVDLTTLEALALLVAPLLALRRRAEASLPRHAGQRAAAAARWLVGKRHPGWKLLGGATLLLLGVAALVPVPHRVAAPSVVEGQLQRVAAAPFDGYIQSSAVRAGDVVRAGQLLATLDDRELQLERVRWQSELELALRKEREAMGLADRVAMRLAGAQAAQAQAQLDLVQDKLQRLALTAPFDAVIVRGDLSQSLGAPVEQGKVLFELAPLEAWRVIVKVDERDVGYLRAGQHGQLVLAGLPGLAYAVQAQRIFAIAESEDGRNHFRVEAGLPEGTANLRPGMEGVAKIEVGSASLLWLASHRAIDWLRRTAWEWSP